MRVVHDRFQRFLASKLEARNPHLVHANTGSPHAQDCAFSASWAQSELAPPDLPCSHEQPRTGVQMTTSLEAGARGVLEA